MNRPEAERWEKGWRVRIPLQREQVRVSKRRVVYEEVDISREEPDETVPLPVSRRQEEPAAAPPPSIEAAR